MAEGGEGPRMRPAAAGERRPLRVVLIPATMPTNPYPALLAAAVERAGVELVDAGPPGFGWLLRCRREVDVLHLHWLHVFYRRDGRALRSVAGAIGFAALLVVARLLGIRLVWTMHNARPHDSPTPAADRIARLAAMNLAEVVIHCEAARPLLAGRKRAGGVHAVPHGSYIGVYPDAISRAAARQRLGIDTERVVFLAFGLIRGYKGLDRLVRTFAGLAASHPRAARATLLVVGKPRDAEDAAAVDALRRECRGADIRWTLEFVPDEDVQVYMRAADFAVAAFENILVSGSAILGLSFGLPLLGPRLGCLPELVAGGAGILYDPPDGLAGALGAALEADRASMAQAARRRAEELDWSMIGRAHARIYAGGKA